jgi:hypothetical protein
MVNIIKLRSTGRKVTPYLAQANTSGEQQKWFAEKVGGPVGACVKSTVKKGMSAGAIKAAVRNCAKKYGRVKKA